MELEEYIKDATDEAMSDYIKSEKYKEHKKQINDLLRNMRENQMILLNQLLDAISVCDGAFASEAYLQGVVEGIALCKKKIKSV